MKIKITFKQSTGEVIASSPIIEISEEALDETHEFCSNAWEEVPECECYDDELVLWFDEEQDLPQHREDFQLYVDAINKQANINLPKFSDWNEND